MIAIALLAVGAGLLQALAGLSGRRALQAQVPPAALVLAWGAGLALAAAPWWAAPGATLLPDPWWVAPAAGLLLMAGNGCFAWALTSGSAALAVPVLSSKVVLVALGMALAGRGVGPAALLGALLTCAGIATLGLGGRGARTDTAHTSGRAIAMALLAALCFAGFDALFALHGPRLGLAGLFPAATAWGLIAALPLLTLVRLPYGGGRGALLLSGGLNGLQCAGLVAAIILAGDAVLPNVLYGCRGLWSVLLALAMTADARAGWRPRLAGAALIASAIGVTLLG